jgi:hypothetical protein
MKVMIEFTKTMLLLPQPWLGWMGLLVAVNMVIPLYYIHTREAKVVLIAAMFGLMIMMAIFGAKGFVRLLGIGHITWVPMLPWLWTRLDDTSFGSFFGYWLIAVIVLDSLSLIVDVVDIRRYIKGERTPHLALNA